MFIITNLQLEREIDYKSTKSIYFKFTHYRFKVH